MRSNEVTHAWKSSWLLRGEALNSGLAGSNAWNFHPKQNDHTFKGVLIQTVDKVRLQ